jgi:hypothetical protein
MECNAVKRNAVKRIAVKCMAVKYRTVKHIAVNDHNPAPGAAPAQSVPFLFSRRSPTVGTKP